MASTMTSFNRLAPELVLEIIGRVTSLESLHCLFEAVPYARQVFAGSGRATLIIDKILDNHVHQNITYLIRLIALVRCDALPFESFEKFQRHFEWPSCKKVVYGSQSANPHRLFEVHESKSTSVLPRSLPPNTPLYIIFHILHVAHRISRYTPECLDFYLERFKKIELKILVWDKNQKLARAGAPKAPYSRGRGRSAVLSWKLDGRKVLVVGGGQVAADRIADALEVGAEVTVVCASAKLEPEIAERAAAGQIEHIARDFGPSDLIGIDMVICAVANPSMCEMIWKLTRKKIPVNIVNVDPRGVRRAFAWASWTNNEPNYPPSYFNDLNVDFNTFVEVWWPPIPPWERGPKKTWHWVPNPGATDYTGPVTWVELLRVARSFWKLELFFKINLALSQKRLRWPVKDRDGLKNIDVVDFYCCVYGFNNNITYHIQAVAKYLAERYIHDNSDGGVSKLRSLCDLPASSFRICEITVPSESNVFQEHDIYNFDYISRYCRPEDRDEPLSPVFPKECFLRLGLPLWQRWRIQSAGFDWDGSGGWDTWFCHLDEKDQKCVLDRVKERRVYKGRSVWYKYYEYFRKWDHKG